MLIAKSLGHDDDGIELKAIRMGFASMNDNVLKIKAMQIGGVCTFQRRAK